jgi:hypothetical protein
MNTPASLCQGNSTISVNAVAGATSYNWSVNSALVTIVSGQGTSSIDVSVASGLTSVAISVTATNCFGTSTALTRSLFGLALPSTSLTGSLSLCPNSSQAYSTVAATGTVTSYAWSVSSSNGTVSNQTATSCTVTTNASWTGGTLTYSVTNSCGTNSKSWTLTAGVPAQPGAITGPASGLCAAGGTTTATYSIAAVTNATSYTWTVPAGMTITANTGTSITVSIGTTFSSGSVSVTANSACGSGTARALAVSKLLPASTSITGSASVCKSATAITYTADAVTGATSYAWAISGGATIAGTTATATANFTTATTTSATVSVKAVNACGTATANKTLAVTVNLACREVASLNGAASVELYPNPAHDRINVAFDAANEEVLSLEIISMAGVKVKQLNVISTIGENFNEVDLDGLTPGVYVLSLRGEKSGFFKKSIVVQ